MKPATAAARFPRRDLLKAGGALLIGFSIGGAARAQQAEGVALVLGPDQPDPKSLDTWIAIHADNTATIFIGFVELGQGCSTALLQLAAEELDLDMSQVKSIRLESHTMPNQGGTVASASIARGGPRIRSAAAEARQALLKMASQKLNANVRRPSRVLKHQASRMFRRSVYFSYGSKGNDSNSNRKGNGRGL